MRIVHNHKRYYQPSEELRAALGMPRGALLTKAQLTEWTAKHIRDPPPSRRYVNDIGEEVEEIGMKAYEDGEWGSWNIQQGPGYDEEAED